jgi:hypothetical protein
VSGHCGWAALQRVRADRGQGERVAHCARRGILEPWSSGSGLGCKRVNSSIGSAAAPLYALAADSAGSPTESTAISLDGNDSGEWRCVQRTEKRTRTPNHRMYNLGAA